MQSLDTFKLVIDNKGGFYHHYASKEELLEDIVRMMLFDMMVIFREIVARDDLSALEKTNEYISQITAYKGDKIVETAAFFAELYSGGKNVQSDLLSL